MGFNSGFKGLIWTQNNEEKMTCSDIRNFHHKQGLDKNALTYPFWGIHQCCHLHLGCSKYLLILESLPYPCSGKFVDQVYHLLVRPCLTGPVHSSSSLHHACTLHDLPPSSFHFLCFLDHALVHRNPKTNLICTTGISTTHHIHTYKYYFLGTFKVCKHYIFLRRQQYDLY